jgi:hypothetical protein
MAKVSELMIGHPEIVSFAALRKLVIEMARSGEVFLEFDVKPDYQDTPRNWHLELETAFYWGDRAQKTKT